MQKFKRILITVAIILVMPIIILAVNWGNRQSGYKDALYSVENYRYELAYEHFQELGNYKDSDKLAAQMQQLTELNQEETLKLIPNCEPNDNMAYNYWIIEGKLGLRIAWDLDFGKDFYVQWSEYEAWGSDKEHANQLYGNFDFPLTTIRYDSETGEYIFLQYTGEDDMQDNRMPLEEWFRGKFNEDGSLEIYCTDGATYVFLPYSFQDYSYAMALPVIINESLTEYVNAGMPED